MGDGAVLVGSTVWAFSREALGDRFDYLVIDEAGVPLRPRRGARPGLRVPGACGRLRLFPPGMAGA